MAKKDRTGEVLAAIASMTDDDRAVAEKLHEVITEAAPELHPRLWYKQPAYADGDGDDKVVVFFRGADVDGDQYTSLGFSDRAALDDGNLWPTAYAVTKVTPQDAEAITALVKKAAG